MIPSFTVVTPPRTLTKIGTKNAERTFIRKATVAHSSPPKRPVTPDSTSPLATCMEGTYDEVRVVVYGRFKRIVAR